MRRSSSPLRVRIHILNCVISALPHCLPNRNEQAGFVVLRELNFMLVYYYVAVGPMLVKERTNEFWMMIWQQKPKAIVMVTKFVEDGRVCTLCIIM